MLIVCHIRIFNQEITLLFFFRSLTFQLVVQMYTNLKLVMTVTVPEDVQAASNIRPSADTMLGVVWN